MKFVWPRMNNKDKLKKKKKFVSKMLNFSKVDQSKPYEK